MSTGIGTLLDLSKLSTDVPAKVVHTIVDAMPLFDQMRFTPCNNGVNNKTLVITDYPEGQARGYNEGVQPEKAGGITVVDSTCMIRSFSQIDKDLLALNKNSAEWRLNQEAAFPIGMAHKMADRVFNASIKKNPKEFDGLCVRYNSIGGQVINAGGSSSANDLTDIWVINWDPTTVHGIYPEGGVAGFTRFDRGECDCYDSNSRRYRGVITDFEWNAGLAVENNRHVVRVANVSQSALDGASAPDLINLLIDAVEAFPVTPGAGCAIYMNSKLRTALRKQIGSKQNVNLTWETVAGRPCVTYDGIPVHKLPTSILKSYSTALS